MLVSDCAGLREQTRGIWKTSGRLHRSNTPETITRGGSQEEMKEKHIYSIFSELNFER